MSFVVKAGLEPEAEAISFSFHEKTMYRGKDIRVHDEIFVFSSGACSSRRRPCD